MKDFIILKIISSIIIFVIYLIPANILAASTTGTSVSGSNSVTIGDALNLTFSVNF